MHIIFRLEYLKGTDRLEHAGAVWIVGTSGASVWIGLIWLRIGTSGGAL